MSDDEIKLYFKKNKLPGFGPARIDNVASSIPQFRKYLDSFAKDDVKLAIDFYINKLKKMEQLGYNKMIENKKFVLTGFMGITDYELEDYIYDNNGDFSSTVTSDVTAVISANLFDIGKKMILASELGIPVLSIREFSERFNVPLKRFDNIEKGIETDNDE